MEDLFYMKNTADKGRGVFAIRNISKGEYIAEFKGPIVNLQSLNGYPEEVVELLFPIGEHSYIMAMEPAVRTNHSCEPNAGIAKEVFLIAMRDINKDEEVTFDYSTVIADNWQLKCLCGTNSCRSIISDYKYLNDDIKQKYYNFTPEWIKNI